MIKTIQTREESYIQFTDEEAAELGLELGDTFTAKLESDGIMFKKHKILKLEISDWPREILEYIINESCDKNVSVNSIIIEAIEKYIKNNSDVNN
jgi:hypothetical protein